MDYEMEYLIGGKNADQENLKAVVNRLLLMREGANLLYLETDSTKSQEAMSVALALTSVVANPELAEPVKHAILAAWAYAESISDVRILLNGGKVSLVKNDTQWHTDLKHLGDALNTSEKNTEQEGLSYDGYLQLLLWTTSEEKIRQRSMNLIEQNTGVCMNQMAGKINALWSMRHNHCSGIWCSLEITRLAAIILQKIVKYVMQSQKSKGGGYITVLLYRRKTNNTKSLSMFSGQLQTSPINQTGNLKIQKHCNMPVFREALHWKQHLLHHVMFFVWYFYICFYCLEHIFRCLPRCSTQREVWPLLIQMRMNRGRQKDI